MALSTSLSLRPSYATESSFAASTWLAVKSFPGLVASGQKDEKTLHAFCHQHPGSTALPAARIGNALLHDPFSQVGLVLTALDFFRSVA